MTFRKLVVVGGVEAVLDPPHRAVLDEVADTLVTVARGVDPGPELADADAAVLGFAIPFGHTAIDAAPQLRYLQIASTAFDAVDVDHARARGITVATLPDYMTEPVAQFVLAAMLEQASGLTQGRALRQMGDLFPLAFPAKQFRGSRVAVVGLGTIGRRVAEMAAGLGAEVRYWSRNPKQDSGFRYQDLDTLLSEADFVSVNLALNDGTRGLLDASRIAALAPGTVLVCTAPLDLIDLPALRARTETAEIHAILNHALPETISYFAGCPGFIHPPVVYLTDQSRALMQDAVTARLREWAGRS